MRISNSVQRDQTLDILKGIGIILMVLGHSGTFSAVADFVYLFHMALFFMASGYVWNDKKAADFAAVRKSVLARLKGLLLPFAVANGCFTLLNNLFVALHIYGPDKVMSLEQTLINLVKNMLFAGDTTMGGASWFFRTLFFVSVAHIVIRYIATHWKFGKAFFFAVAAATFLGAAVINHTRWTFPMGIHTCFCGYAAFLMGYFLKKCNFAQWIQKFRYPAMLLSFVGLALLSLIDTIGLGAGNIGNLPFFITVSLLGWCLCWTIATALSGLPARFLCLCGRKSVWIVFCHFLAFKPVALVYLLITGGDMSLLSAFPVYAVSWLWIAYTVVGTVLPLALCLGYGRVRTMLQTSKKPL